MKRTAFSAIGIVVLASGLGCAAWRQRPAILESSVGPSLSTLMDAHGGYRHWSRYRGASFRYRARLARGALMEARVAVVFSEPARIWVEERGGEAHASWSPLSLEEGFGAALQAVLPRFQKGSAPFPTPAEAHFSLLSVRNTFALPFVLATGGWKFRSFMAPASHAVDTSDEIHAVPPAGSDRLGPYLIKRAFARDANPLDRLYYASSHPGSPAGVCELRLGGFRLVNDMEIATRQAHYLRIPASREKEVVRDPLRLAPREPSAKDEPFLEEQIDDIRFLSRSEVEEIFAEMP